MALSNARSRRLKWFAPLLFAPLIAACAQAPVDNALYSADRCHRLDLISSENGTPVIGVEDMVRLPGGDLLISAYDRRDTTDEGIPPEGGLYILERAALREKHHEVTSLFETVQGGLRPHGIGIHAETRDDIEVGVVNRSFDEDGSPTPSILRFTLRNGEAQALTTVNDDRLCAANDIALAPAENLHAMEIAPESLGATDDLVTLITNDRKHCAGWALLWERITGIEEASLVAVDENGEWLGPIEDGLAFANGLGVRLVRWDGFDEEFVAVAETRANRIRYIPNRNNRPPVTLPGSPDNLTVAPTALTLAAVHPSLIRLALYRHNWPFFDKAPSRIVKVTGNQILVLFDDPTGDTFSAASVAVQTAGKLVLGSVGEPGLLVCTPAGEEAALNG